MQAGQHVLFKILICLKLRPREVQLSKFVLDETRRRRHSAPALPGRMAMNAPSNAVMLTLSIAAVERDTGLSKDTLRVWERR